MRRVNFAYKRGGRYYAKISRLSCLLNCNSTTWYTKSTNHNCSERCPKHMLLPVVVLTMATVVLTINLRIPAHVAGPKERCNYQAQIVTGPQPSNVHSRYRWILPKMDLNLEAAVSGSRWIGCRFIRFHTDNQLLGNILYSQASDLGVLKILVAATDNKKKYQFWRQPMEAELISALPTVKSWRRFSLQPTTLSNLGFSAYERQISRNRGVESVRCYAPHIIKSGWYTGRHVMGFVVNFN